MCNFFPLFSTFVMVFAKIMAGTEQFKKEERERNTDGFNKRKSNRIHGLERWGEGRWLENRPFLAGKSRRVVNVAQFVS